MSIEQMTEVWKLKLSHSNQSLLLALADHAHDDGTKCFPGVDRLAWKTGYSRRQVIRILQDLEDKELIEAQSEKVGGRGNATEYHLHLEKGDKKTPFRRAVKSDTVTPFGGGKGDNSDGKGDISDGKGDIAVSPQPSQPSGEPSSQASAESQEKPKGRQDRSKPDAPDHRACVHEFFSEHEPLADEMREYIARAAARNESGEMTYSRQWRAFCLPVKLALRDGASEDAVLYALQESNNASARSISYFETVLEANPDGRPARRSSSTDPRTNEAQPGVAGGASPEGAARRTEGYEWLFEAGERGGAAEAEPQAPETDGDSRPDEGYVEYMRRAKLVEQHMRKWRTTMDDKEYQRQVFILRNRAAENGIGAEDVWRLDEQIRAEHAERVG